VCGGDRVVSTSWAGLAGPGQACWAGPGHGSGLSEVILYFTLGIMFFLTWAPFQTQSVAKMVRVDSKILFYQTLFYEITKKQLFTQIRHRRSQFFLVFGSVFCFWLRDCLDPLFF
jgi:hypothetical protein